MFVKLAPLVSPSLTIPVASLALSPTVPPALPPMSVKPALLDLNFPQTPAMFQLAMWPTVPLAQQITFVEHAILAIIWHQILVPFSAQLLIAPLAQLPTSVKLVKPTSSSLPTYATQ
jgi:hypothetical protein